MRSVCRWAFMVLAAGSLAMAVSAEPPSPPSPPDPPDVGFITPDVAHLHGLQHLQQQSRVAELAKRYLKAERESEKREIRQKMTELLNQSFDEHMKRQQKELEDLEKQIADLRAIIKKREGAKATIVDRRVEQLIQDAEGLGWNVPGTSWPSFRNGFFWQEDVGPKVKVRTKSAD